MIKGVIFDMDGLMFDTEPIWGSFWQPALAAFGLEYKEGLDQAARGLAGEATRRLLCSYYGPDCPAGGIVEKMHAIASERFRAPVPKKPGLDELLAWLDAQGIPMAVASSSPQDVIRTNLANGHIAQYFRAIVSGDMVSRSKPAPDCFLLAAGQLGVAPRDCLVLEDSHNGVRAGAAGGFVTVMVPDLLPDNDEMRRLYTMKCGSLHEVLAHLRSGAL